jgi:hypothetical protein
MSVNGKIQVLNTAIREAIPLMQKEANENPNAQVLVRALKFSSGAQWHIAQPCILREVVDRPNLGRKRPLRSKGHHHNLPDKTRTVAGVVAKTINC